MFVRFDSFVYIYETYDLGKSCIPIVTLIPHIRDIYLIVSFSKASMGRTITESLREPI